ncbi:MAG: hypothetical protein IIY87_02205, partial [Bacteroidales bacterium]|nr:hypothetical protein [Bacteroidales bacterium]
MKRFLLLAIILCCQLSIVNCLSAQVLQDPPHNSQFSILTSQFSIHNSHFTILNSQFSTIPINLPLLMAGDFGEIRPNHFHSGIDIRTEAKEGQPVYAPADGYVSRID